MKTMSLNKVILDKKKSRQYNKLVTMISQFKTEKLLQPHYFCVYSLKTVCSTVGKFSINITVFVFKSRTLQTLLVSM